jgi:hypothetical protein
MTNHTDDAVLSAENDMKGPGIRGPRSKYFYCIAWKAKQHGPVEASTVEEASESWANDHDGVRPDVVCGGDVLRDNGGGSGYYLAKGTGMGDAQRLSVTVPAKHLRHTQTQIHAQFKGWFVYANCLKGFSSENESFDDDELAILIFDKPIDDKNKVPKQKLKKNEAVRVSDLVQIDD